MSKHKCKWILFHAEPRQPGGLDRKYAHTGSLTSILFEHYDCSNRELPEPGYRPPQYIQVPEFIDPNAPGAKTHWRDSDWVVTHVETFTPDIPISRDYDMIVICYCKYEPIDSPLIPLPPRQVSLDSFGGDKEAYKQWQESQKQPASVS